MTQEGLDAEVRDWKLIRIDNKEKQMSCVMRLRVRRPELPEEPPFADAIEISWSYQSNDAYPPPEVNQKQLAFERALDDLSGPNGFSELVQVTTGMGRKEWLYYSCNRARFMKELNARLAGHEPYSLTIEFYEDPQWQILGARCGVARKQRILKQTTERACRQARSRSSLSHGSLSFEPVRRDVEASGLVASRLIPHRSPVTVRIDGNLRVARAATLIVLDQLGGAPAVGGRVAVRPDAVK